MNTVICQGCGSILRSAGTVCQACGTTVSRFSKTELPSIVSTGAPLAVAPESDPLTVERAMNRMIYQAELRAQPTGSQRPADGPAYAQLLEQMQPVPAEAPRAQNEEIPSFFDTTYDTARNSPLATSGDTTTIQGKAPYLVPSPDGALPDIVAQAVETANTMPQIVETPIASESASSAVPAQRSRKAKQSSKQLSPARQPKAKSGQSKMIFLVVLLLAFALAAAMQFAPKPAPSLSNDPAIGGIWSFDALTDDGETVHFTAKVEQDGEKITGIGQELRKSFTLSGKYNYPNIAFVKTYTDKNYRPLRGWFPVEFSGEFIRYKDNQIHDAQGTWKLDKLQAGGVRRIRLSNDWRAVVTPMPAKVDESPWSNLLDKLGWPANTPERLQRLFFSIACAIFMFGIAIVCASVKMFGPSGYLNRLAKKEYIPSQYKAQHKKGVREFGKRLQPGGLPLGKRVDWHPLQLLPQELAIPPEVREHNPHIIVLGAGSKGKSRLLARMIAHDIESNDRAVVVIDSDGALVDLTLSWIAAHPQAEKFSKRVIVVDPTHGGEVPCFNPLEYPEDGDLQSAAHALMFGFKALYMEPQGSQNQWSQQTADILRNSAILLMANGKSLTDLPVLLTENDFRDILLEKIEKQKNDKPEFTALSEAWSRYKRMARTDQWITWIEPILNRVNPILSDPRLRPILTKPNGDLNLVDVIKDQKILLVKVPQGQLHQSANLLGSLVVTSLKQAAMSLSMRSSTRKRPCSLYLDEFDSFMDTDTFESITKETRKFQIGLVGAARTMQTLPEDFRNQLVINVGTVCCFALAKKDGDLLGPQMFRVDGRKIKHQTLQNLFNKVNSVPNFELITDEEKLNIDRLVGQDNRTFFCYQVGDVAKVFQLRAPDFADPPEKSVRWKLIDEIYARRPRRS